MMFLLELKNQYLENLKYRISISEKNQENKKRIPIFTEQIKEFDKAVVILEGKFNKIQLREKYKIIITELDNLINQAR